jgi:hypothetical protein
MGFTIVDGRFVATDALGDPRGAGSFVNSRLLIDLCSAVPRTGRFERPCSMFGRLLVPHSLCEYVFYVDVEAPAAAPAMVEALSEVSEHATFRAHSAAPPRHLSHPLRPRRYLCDLVE